MTGRIQSLVGELAAERVENRVQRSLIQGEAAEFVRAVLAHNDANPTAKITMEAVAAKLKSEYGIHLETSTTLSKFAIREGRRSWSRA